MTGIDFFAALPDELERKLENHFNISDWSFAAGKPNSRSGMKTQYEPTNSMQCIGITKKGNRCKNKAAKGKLACRLHQ
jgi:hypothetical protein